MKTLQKIYEEFFIKKEYTLSEQDIIKVMKEVHNNAIDLCVEELESSENNCWWTEGYVEKLKYE